MILTTDDWTLTIHYWPRATEAGVRPQGFDGFTADENPALYHPHGLDFSYPPTRQDFFAVVARTPWMHGWRESLLPIISNNAWPMMMPGYKGASVDLIDEAGRRVGRIEVWRKQRYCNQPYFVPFVGVYAGSEVDRLIKRRIRDGEAREQARQHVEANRHRILERVVDAGEKTDASVMVEVERCLTDGGFLKARRRAVA